MGMMETSYTVRFVTPAFLGDAHQRARWRTPPFKSLIRQWWRVAAAKGLAYDWKRLREKEGALFGHAWLDNWAMRSGLRILLDNWQEGGMNNWKEESNVKHPEVKMLVDAYLYLGYGPLNYDKVKKTTVLKNSAPCIAPDETATLTLQYAEGQAETVRETLKLVQVFGTIGGRSRNGWGSFVLEGKDVKTPQEIMDSSFFSRSCLGLQACLRLDWPHAVGMDNHGPLVWRSEPCGSWKEAQMKLAKIKIAFRTSCSLSKNNGPHNLVIDERHFLSYPVTHHPVNGWGSERLANQMRFKVLPWSGGQLVALVYHLPHRMPDVLMAKYKGAQPKVSQLDIWKKVHSVLDGHKGLTRVKGGV